jgi:hypothetical protein
MKSSARKFSQTLQIPISEVTKIRLTTTSQQKMPRNDAKGIKSNQDRVPTAAELTPWVAHRRTKEQLAV